MCICANEEISDDGGINYTYLPRSKSIFHYGNYKANVTNSTPLTVSLTNCHGVLVILNCHNNILTI